MKCLDLRQEVLEGFELRASRFPERRRRDDTVAHGEAVGKHRKEFETDLPKAGACPFTPKPGANGAPERGVSGAKKILCRPPGSNPL